MINGHIKPYWNINDFIGLRYNRSTIDETFLKEYISKGHSDDQICIYNFFENDDMPASALEIKNHFNHLNPISVAVNYFVPGTYLPKHSDLYKRWMEVFNVNDIDRIERIIVMLQDHKPGQFTEIGDKIINSWSAGDWFSWVGNTPHAVYNFSLYDRYALQITGYCI